MCQQLLRHVSARVFLKRHKLQDLPTDSDSLPCDKVLILILIVIKIQLDAVVYSLIYLTAKSLYMFRVTQHPSSGVLKTVTAASGTGHNIGIATSFQPGQVGAGLC